MTSAADIHSLRYATPDDIDEADLEDELNALEAEMVHCSALRDRSIDDGLAALWLD
jgi:hypothetical protein